MKCIFLFFFVLFFGIFDFIWIFMFFLFFLLFFVLDFGYFWFGGVFFCDSLSFFLVYLSVYIFFFVFFSSLIDVWSKNFFWGFTFIVSFIFFCLILCFVCFSMFMFYVCFEFIFMLMFIFLLVWGYSPERLQASFYMVFYTIVVSFPFLVYVISLELSSLAIKFGVFHFTLPYCWFLVFLVFLVKLPVYMVHLWLPKAHVEAPVSGSMLLAGVLLKLGGYGMLRFSIYFSYFFMKYGSYFLSVGLVGGLLCCFLCLRQADLKAFVAYSSVCHMGFGLGGLYSMSFFGYYGAVYMLIAHGFCSSCLFYILYIFYERFHSRSLFLVKGISLLVPIMMLVWFVFCILNMGVPPSFSFFSEVAIVTGLLKESLYSLVFVGLFLFFAGVYGIFLYIVCCHGMPFFDSVSLNFSVREYLNIFGHFPSLLFIPLFLMNYF